MKGNNQTTEGKQTLTSQQKQTMKKYVVFALLFVIFGACLWLIFAPSADEKAKTEATAGFNADIPMPKEEGIIGDKKSAYENEQMKQRQDEKMRSLQDFAYMLGNDKNPSGNLVPPGDKPVKSDAYKPQRSRPAQSSIQTSANAYRDINHTLGTFYESPKEDPERERLARELEELKAKLAENETRENTV